MARAPAVQHELSLAEYEALCDRGVLAEAKVELLDGQVVSMAPQGEEHVYVIQALTRLLAPALADLRIQAPVRAGTTSMPEPDLALPAHRDRGRAPERCRLVVEVVVSAWYEAQRKLPIYAAAGHEVCWIVHEPKRRVLVYEQPSGREYGRCRVLTGADVLEVPRSAVAFTVDELFAIAAEY